MRIILITRPDFFSGEGALIGRMLEGGLPLLHIRKPEADKRDMERLIISLPKEYWHRIVVHSHYDLIPKLGLRGAHLGRGRNLPPDFPTDIPTSYSCHSIEEVMSRKWNMEYVCLSPIFTSISKKGYQSAFTAQQISEAHRHGIIDEKVIALGGIGLERLAEVKEMGFGGAAILGDVWLNPDPVARLKELLKLTERINSDAPCDAPLPENI